MKAQMKAQKILQGINIRMTKAEIMANVIRAQAELDLKDTAQVAQELNVSKMTVWKRAAYHNIGTLVGERARVYSPSDVEALRRLIFPPTGQHRPETAEMIEKMRVMREGGSTLASIGHAFGVSESYVSKLLK